MLKESLLPPTGSRGTLTPVSDWTMGSDVTRRRRGATQEPEVPQDSPADKLAVARMKEKARRIEEAHERRHKDTPPPDTSARMDRLEGMLGKLLEKMGGE